MSDDMPSEAGDPNHQVCISHPDLLDFLSSAYEFLRKVFSYLNLDDLGNAARAYDSWKPVAEVTKRERCVIETFLLSDGKYQMSPIWSEAAFCITFCTAPNPDLEEKATRYVHSEGKILYCLARTGVIGTLNDLSRIVQQKVRIDLPLAPKKFYLSCLRIPKLARVGMEVFVWEEKDSFESFRKNFHLPEDESVKCLLVLAVPEGDRTTHSLQIEDFISFLQKRQKESFAVGGCAVDDFENEGRKNPDDSMVKYVVFYGKNVEAASTVLTPDVKSSTAIDDKVSRLKRRCPEAKKGALFVFRCTGRQKVIRRYRPKNDITKWEGEALAKYFPDTPIVGCFGYGEFGNEHPSGNDLVSPNKRFRGSETWEYSFSTSLVYLGFK